MPCRGTVMSVYMYGGFHYVYPYLYVYIHIYIYIHMYIYIHIHISSYLFTKCKLLSMRYPSFIRVEEMLHVRWVAGSCHLLQMPSAMAETRSRVLCTKQAPNTHSCSQREPYEFWL